MLQLPTPTDRPPVEPADTGKDTFTLPVSSDYNCLMKLLHVGKYYPPQVGGMETVLENMASGLLAAGQDVSVVVAGQSPMDRTGPLDLSGGRQVHLLRLATFGVVNSQPLTPGLYSSLRREIHRFRPDLIHIHLPNPLLAMNWLALAYGPERRGLPPMVVWHHADITRQKWGRILAGPVVRSCLRLSAGIAVSSSSLLAGSRDLAPVRDKVRVIPFGIDPSPWTDVRPAHDGPFLFIGRLVRYKGLDILLEAVSQVPDARLILVGEGPLREELAGRIRSLGLVDRVELAGFLSRADILEIMACARGLVLPSVDASETFGLVQLEAMAAGLPVVAADIPTGVSEVGVPGETCLLAAAGDSSGLAAVLGRLQADSGRCARLGENGRGRFLARFSREGMTSSLLDWYEEILSRSGRDRKE